MRLERKYFETILKKINILLSNYLPDIYRYNSLIKNRNYYLKPIHIVVKKTSSDIVKYMYYGRYWYRLVKKPGGVKWVYIGRSKPERDLPDPPSNPLEGLVLKITSSEVVVLSCTRELYDKIRDVLVSS